MLTWDDYNADSGAESVPLLVSERSQSLILAAMQYLDFRTNWNEVSDADWDDIEKSTSQAYEEIMRSVMSDFSPVGTIVAFANYNSVPAKWLYCNGSLISQTTYPELYAICGTIYGALSGGNFRLPELRQRMIFGALNSPSYEQGVYNGVEATSISISNMPAHSHVVPAHEHEFNVSAATGTGNRVARGTGTSVTTQPTNTEPATNTGSVGAGASFNIMNPHLCVGYIIKALP